MGTPPHPQAALTASSLSHSPSHRTTLVLLGDVRHPRDRCSESGEAFLKENRVGYSPRPGYTVIGLIFIWDSIASPAACHPIEETFLLLRGAVVVDCDMAVAHSMVFLLYYKWSEWEFEPPVFYKVSGE